MSQARTRPPTSAPIANGEHDPVLAELHEAEAEYRAQRDQWEQDRAALEEARAEAERTRKENAQLQKRAKSAQAALQQARDEAARHQQRAAQLAVSLKEVHRALFDGNVYSLILKACLTIIGATRGLYITASGADDVLRVRAAVDIDGYPAAPPSAFIEALSRRVLTAGDTVICDEDDHVTGLPAPAREGERFRNYVIAPVMLLHHFDGIILAADKIRGGFDKEDVATLLSVGDQATVAVQNVRLQRQLEQAYLGTVAVLANTMEVKDPHTQGHCEQVSQYARLVANHLGLSREERSIVCYAALLHDVGKIGVSDGLLNKIGPLSAEETELMRAHVRMGRDLISRVPGMEPVGEVVLHHHEWFDGHGYPDGLRGEDIPIAARIVSVVDSYCAMIMRRSYKEAYSPAYARAELERCAGTQFDPKIVRAFLAVLDTPEGADLDDDEAECHNLPGFSYNHPAQ
ncbi:MAG TPA: HD domain-containing phosphohydrolase [Chloroflexia bacterium]|nr:HD domain-containing phosphohydrolase [Chloroflexia bacterium]